MTKAVRGFDIRSQNRSLFGPTVETARNWEGRIASSKKDRHLRTEATGNRHQDVATSAQNDNEHRITVLVADDHPVVREGLVALINRQRNMHVIAEADNGCTAVERFFAERPDIAVLDLRMSIMEGIETVTSICEKEPAARIAIVSSYQNEEDVYRVLRAGAQGYIVKDAPVDEIVGCVRAVAMGSTWIPPKVGAKLAKRIGGQDLTPRETDVLHAVTAGKSNKEVGSAFNISEATVKVHMTHILEKLRVTGRTEAINVAVKRGLVRLDDSVAA